MRCNKSRLSEFISDNITNLIAKVRTSVILHYSEFQSQFRKLISQKQIKVGLATPSLKSSDKIKFSDIFRCFLEHFALHSRNAKVISNS